MVLLLLQVVFRGGNSPSSVVETYDETSPDMGWMVGSEVQIAVSVRRLPVHCDVQAAVLLPPETGIKEGVEFRLSPAPW